MNIFLRNLPRKTFRNPDELERALKSYVAGARVTGDDSEGFTLQTIEEDGKHTYKIHLISDGGSSERVTVERVEQLNSKENSMNYYEKIIQEKKNDSQVIERGVIKGVKYFIEKITGYKRSVYRGNLEKDGRVVTSTWTCDTIDECKREINKLRDTDALLNNSKEEKDNSTVLRGTVHGHKYEVDRMSDGSYMGYVYDEEDFPIFKTGLHSTSSGAEQEIKSKVFNSKENGETITWGQMVAEMRKRGLNEVEIRKELKKAGFDSNRIEQLMRENSKDNSKVLDAEIASYSDPNTHEKYYKVWLVTDEGRRNPRVFKTFQEADREAARIQREVKSQNSKEKTNISSNFYSLIEEGKKRINHEYEMEIQIAKNKYERRKGQPGAENDFSAEIKKIEDKHQKEIEKLWKEISEQHR